MKFTNKEEMIQYINENFGDDISNIDITFFNTLNESVEEKINESIDVTLYSLGNSPKVHALLSENIENNLLYVKSYESLPESCGTGKISFMDRSFYANICEMDNNATITLEIVKPNSEDITKVPFKLVLEENRPADANYFIVLKKDEK